MWKWEGVEGEGKFGKEMGVEERDGIKFGGSKGIVPDGVLGVGLR